MAAGEFFALVGLLVVSVLVLGYGVVRLIRQRRRLELPPISSPSHVDLPVPMEMETSVWQFPKDLDGYEMDDTDVDVTDVALGSDVAYVHNDWLYRDDESSPVISQRTTAPEKRAPAKAAAAPRSRAKTVSLALFEETSQVLESKLWRAERQYDLAMMRIERLDAQLLAFLESTRTRDNKISTRITLGANLAGIVGTAVAIVALVLGR